IRLQNEAAQTPAPHELPQLQGQSGHSENPWRPSRLVHSPWEILATFTLNVVRRTCRDRRAPTSQVYRGGAGDNMSAPLAGRKGEGFEASIRMSKGERAQGRHESTVVIHSITCS